MKEVKELSIWEKKKIDDALRLRLERKEKAKQAYPEVEKETFELPGFIWESAMLIADDRYTELNAYLKFYTYFDPYTGWKTKEGEIDWLLGEAEKAPDWIKNKVVARLKAL